MGYLCSPDQYTGALFEIASIVIRDFRWEQNVNEAL